VRLKLHDHEMKITLSAHDTETISDQWTALENIEKTSDVPTSQELLHHLLKVNIVRGSKSSHGSDLTSSLQ